MLRRTRAGRSGQIARLALDSSHRATWGERINLNGNHTMKRFVFGLVAAAALSTAAFASDVMAPRFGNTVVLTAPNGQVTKLMYNADGTMDIVTPDGAKGKGKWAMEGDKLCVTPDAGPNAGQKQCNPTSAHKVGDEWEIGLPDGSKMKAKLVAGR
jgi:hypothetical protein